MTKKSCCKIFMFSPFICWERGMNMMCQDIKYNLDKYHHNMGKIEN